MCVCFYRIFQFANFKLTKKRVLQTGSEDSEGAMVSQGRGCEWNHVGCESVQGLLVSPG